MRSEEYKAKFEMWLTKVFIFSSFFGEKRVASAQIRNTHLNQKNYKNTTVPRGKEMKIIPLWYTRVYKFVNPMYNQKGRECILIR